jgi:flavodoxin
VFGAISQAYASEEADAKTLVVYYSKTGNTKAASQIVKKAYHADVVEIKDLVDRFTTWGSITGMIYSLFGWHTDIKPEFVDVTPYERIVIGTPIWGDGFPTAMLTFVEKNNFKGKKIVIFSTSTNIIDKEVQDKMIALVVASRGNVIGYFQVQAEREVSGEMQRKSIGEIEKETRDVVEVMRKTF